MEEDDEGLGFHTPQQDFIDEKKKQCEVAPEMVDYDVFKPQIDDDSRGGETYMSVSNSLSVEGEPSIVEQRCEQVSIQRDDSGDEKPSNAEVVPEIEVSHVEETLTVEQRRDSIEQPEVVSEIKVSHLDVEEELVQLGDEIEIEIGDYEVEELIDVFESVEVSTDISNDSQVHRITNVLEFEGLHEIGDSHFEVSHSVRIDAAADDEEGAPKDLEGTFSVQRFEVLSQIGHSHVEESPGVHAGEEGDLPKVLEGGMNVQSFEDCPMVYDDETDIVVDKDDALKELEETSSVQQFKVSPIVHDDETNAPKYLEETLNAQQLEVSPMVHDDGPGIVADKKDVLKDLEGVSNIQQFKVLPQIGDSQGEKPENVQKSEVAPMVDADEADVVADKEDGQKDLDGTSVQQLEVLPQIGDSQVEEPLNARQEEVSPMVDATVDNEEKEAPKDSFKVQVIGVLEESTAIVEGVSPMDIEENVPVEPRAQESETLLQVEEIYVEKPTDIQQFVVSPMAEDEDKKNVLKDPPNAQEVEVLPRTGDEDELSNKAVEENVLVEPSTVSQFEALPEAGVSKESTLSNEVSARVEKENVPDEALDAQGFKAPETEDSHVVEEEISPMVEEEDALLPDVEMDSEVAETEGGETSGGGIGKRKRGRPAKAQIKTPPPKKKEKKEEEDVCFICFDGGNLVLCDRRGCPKAYHPTCVNRDEAFFRSKGRWNCGWHLCSICEKAAHYMCYTCTYSLCKGCIKEAEFYCVRGSKGFCETCMRTVRLIEKNEQGDKTQVNFNDKNSWEYLFKEYWIDLKRKLSMTLDELSQARNPWNGSAKVESSDELYDGNNDHGSNSDSSSENIEVISNTKKRKGRKQSKLSKEVFPSVVAVGGGGEGTSTSSSAEWASKDLLEFVSHMKKGDTSVLSQFDVQALLLEYIKQNNLRDPRKKSQIVCDSRLENLFGKARVGHFEMLKLLESHFLIKEDSQADDTRGEIVDTESSQLEVDGGSDSLKKRRKSRKKGDERLSQTNLDEYAAINVHNIHLLYLRRNLMEDLLDDSEKFHDRVVGSFVRIRISGSGQKHDMYRLVQVVGTRKVPDQYKTGKRSTDIVLEIVNLSKTESISIDTVSNQDFSEDECMRLRQSIKCGLISRMTVGELQEKAIVLQEVRVNDWLETEKLRLSNLRDRASDRGRRKELRECIEKLQLLKTPEERLRRLREIPEVQADPHMDPNYESEEDAAEQEDIKHDNYMRPRDSGFIRKAREPISPGKLNPALNDVRGGLRKSPAGGSSTNASTRDKANESSWINGNDVWEKPQNLALGSSSEKGGWSGNGAVKARPSSGFAPESTALTPVSTGVAISSNISETDKIWNYMDPLKKIHGPFSMVQLRKWSTTGYFPPEHKVWRVTDKQDDSILLTDALIGKFYKEPSPLQASNSSQPQQNDLAMLDNNRESNRGGSGSNGWTSPTPHFRGGQDGSLSRGWDSTKGSNSWTTPYTQVHNTPHPSPSFPGKPQGTSWNSGQNHGNSNRASVGQQLSPNNWGSSSQLWSSPPVNNSAKSSTPHPVEVPKFQVDGWAANQDGRNNSSNLPSPTPKLNNSGQASDNKWSSIPVASHPANFERATPVTEPNKSSFGLSELTDFSSPPTPTPTVGDWTVQSAETKSADNKTSGFASPTPAQELPTSNFVSDTQKAQLSNSNPWEQNTQPPEPVATNCSVGAKENPSMGNSNPGWGNASTGWGGPSQGNANIGWRPPPLQGNTIIGQGTMPQGPPASTSVSWGGQPPQGNINPAWGPSPPQGIANVAWGPPVPQAQGNTTAGWGPAQVQGGANPGWNAPPQGITNPGWNATPQGNTNSGWSTALQGNTNFGQGTIPDGSVNNSNWGNQQNFNGDRSTGGGSRGGGRGDFGRGGGRASWDRQSSFGGGASAGGSSRQGICRFHVENGYCKKGATCKYLHQ